MISIVMEGTDEKGKLYIVKAKRKGIDAKIIQGLQQLKNIVSWLHYLPFQFPIQFIYTQFETMIVEQLSFENEIKHHQQFKKNNEYNTNIVVPDIIHEYCTPMQIVMTKIEGSHYSSSISSELCNTYVQYITEMTTKNIIIDGFIHSDLHAGNMLFTPDHKIGVIDFGLMIRLTVKERQSFYDLLQYLSTQDYEKAVDVVITELLEPQHVIKSLSTIQLRSLKQSFIDLYIRIYSIQKSLSVKDICSVIYIAYTYNLTVSTVFYKLMFFIVSCQCFIHKLSPFYFHSFIEKLKHLFTEFNEDE
jgi:predicted unusual protein kinase regulating ubiquinone biosynthesis (AarF/ABC1/UbiB family)